MITASHFGTLPNGTHVTCYHLRDETGCGADFLDYGCIVRALYVLDQAHAITDVCLGYDTLDGYVQNNDYMGAILGRHANRIARGTFELNGRTCALTVNDGVNHMHGGEHGFHKKCWHVEVLGENAIRFFRCSTAGEEGYPGNLNVSVDYHFEDQCLAMVYHAVADEDTVVNLSNHTYFNLSGGRGDALSHWLQIDADCITENDGESLPTGKLLPVTGTPFDFRMPHQIGDRIHWSNTQLAHCGGYDHDFALNSGTPAARLWHPDTGIRMTVYTDMPSLEVYTANALTGSSVGKNGNIHSKYAGICMETQFFPNGMACEQFTSPVLKAGQAYHSQTRFHFGITDNAVSLG